MATKVKTTPVQLKYADLIQQSQQELDQADVQYKVEEAKLQLQGDILVTKQSLTKAEKVLVEATRAYPFNPKAVVEAQVEVEAFKDGLGRLEALNSLF